MTINRKKEVMLAVLICAGIFTTSIYAAEHMPPENYLARSAGGGLVEITRADFNTGIESAVDTIDTSIAGFARGINWQIYDPVHRRIFFQEALTDVIIRTRVYEIDTRRYFSLPYDNYMGEYAPMIISPHSEYVLFTYEYLDDTLWSPDDYKTVVLDGATLNQLGERVGVRISIEQAWRSIVSGNNRLLFNPEYLPVSDTSKEDAYTIFSLPDLQPVDTLFHLRMEWRGRKAPVDFSQEGLLFVAAKADSSRDLLPGTYAFVVDGRERRPSSRVVPIAPVGRDAVRLTPEGDEIVVVYSDSGKVRRYELSSGRMVGETEVPSGWHFVFFGEDGNLYLRHGWELEYAVVDYRNNRVARTFTFERR